MQTKHCSGPATLRPKLQFDVHYALKGTSAKGADTIGAVMHSIRFGDAIGEYSSMSWLSCVPRTRKYSISADQLWRLTSKITAQPKVLQLKVLHVNLCSTPGESSLETLAGSQLTKTDTMSSGRSIYADLDLSSCVKRQKGFIARKLIAFSTRSNS